MEAVVPQVEVVVLMILAPCGVLVESSEEIGGFGRARGFVGDAGDAGAGASGTSEVNRICNFPGSVINEPYSNHRL